MRLLIELFSSANAGTKRIKHVAVAVDHIHRHRIAGCRLVIDEYQIVDEVPVEVAHPHCRSAESGEINLDGGMIAHQTPFADVDRTKQELSGCCCRRLAAEEQ